jgi:hypothetical protein
MSMGTAKQGAFKHYVPRISRDMTAFGASKETPCAKYPWPLSCWIRGNELVNGAGIRHQLLIPFPCISLKVWLNAPVASCKQWQEMKSCANHMLFK